MQEHAFSGFIADYRGLQPVALESGTVALRWTHPELPQRRYSALIIEPVVFYPRPQVRDQVGHAALAAIAGHADQRLRDAAERAGIALTATAGAGVLRLRSAFTSIAVRPEGLSVRDAIPIRLIVKGITLAAGEGDYQVTLHHEFEMRDTQTGEVMVKAVRKGKTLDLANRHEQLTLGHARPLLDRWGMDVEAGFAQIVRLLARAP